MERLRSAFDTVAGASLRSNSEVFLKLAREHLGQHQQSAAAALTEREKAIETMLTPIREALGKTEQQMLRIEKERAETLRQPARARWNRSRSVSRRCRRKRARW